ncbi:MAG: glycoside hydrolase family 32 protein [Candidatus Latescibacteria bacterium]|nr:glycoside hydrolase family 32 protein [Candidatus Latescibacterota bacterium]
MLQITKEITVSARKSLVPQYRFPEELEAQETALAENPLMLRLHHARKAYDGDPHRPIYHYVNPEAMLNDPNGLCFWQGNWHLFYQAYPPEDARQHWGHAISTDLVHWRDLPYCIYPDPEDKCFSGATLVEEDRVIAMYHGTEVGNMVAISSDALLLNWEKVAGKAVIPMSSPDGTELPYRVFDPCIWKKDKIYYALSAGTKPEGPAGKPVRANFLFRSTDLEHWEYMHPFVEDDAYSLVGDDGACPYFWPIGDRHILLFFSHMSGGQYLIGDYDTIRDKFVVTQGGKFNFGAAAPAGVHAPSATPDGEGGIIAIFNMNPGKPTDGWNQIMSLPRRLTVTGDKIHIEPAGDLESLRNAPQIIEDIALNANEEVVANEIRGNALELQLRIEPGDAPMVEVNVLRSPGREEYTRIAFFRNRGYRGESLITIDTSYASTAADVVSRAPETAPISLEPEEPLDLRIFLDKSVVEVFANGKQCVAVRVYPERDDSQTISFKSQGVGSQISSLTCWEMKSIWT